MKVHLLLIALLAGAAPNVTAQTADVKILLPLVVEQPIPGAHGSEWRTRIGILNHGERNVILRGYLPYGHCQIQCVERPTPPGVTFYPRFFEEVNGAQGFLLHTTSEDLPLITITLHAQDVSRQSLTWGTEIPVIPETEALTSRVVLGDIPLEPRFRSRLRVYDFDATRERPGRIRYEIRRVRPELLHAYEIEQPWPEDELLAEGELLLAVRHHGAYPKYSPGYAELPLDNLVGEGRVRVTLIPLEPLRFWSFVTVTNNVTQHITTITP